MNASQPRGPWRPPSLDSEAVRLLNALSATRALPDMNGLPMHTSPAPDRVRDAVALDLAIGGAPGRLSVPSGLLRLVLRDLDPAAPEASGEWLGLLVELALTDMLASLEGAEPALEIRFGGAAGEWEFVLGVAVGDDLLRLDLSREAARPVAAALARLPTVRGRRPDLAVPLAVRALAARVTIGGLRGLSPGDVVLADGLAGGDVLIVAGERLACRAAREGGRLLVTTELGRAARSGWEDWLMSEGAEVLPEKEDVLADLPVRLGFELGRLELTLAELETVGPGHVFELARAEAEAVDIVANGRRIGRGRIVEVAGAIGVQVVRLG